jgi:hypothetical protein
MSIAPNFTKKNCKSCVRPAYFYLVLASFVRFLVEAFSIALLNRAIVSPTVLQLIKINLGYKRSLF